MIDDRFYFELHANKIDDRFHMDFPNNYSSNLFDKVLILKYNYMQVAQQQKPSSIIYITIYLMVNFECAYVSNSDYLKISELMRTV